MLFLSVLHHYLFWHYTRAFGEILHLAKNFYWFTYHFFSLRDLVLSLFAPWKRMTEERGNTFSFEDLASFIIIGFISRLIGFILRSVIILSGLTTLLFLTISIIICYVFWVLAPVLLVLSLYYGLVLLFS